MGFRSFLIRPFARSIARSIARWSAKAVECQEKTMHQIVAQAANTAFGRDHNFSKIRTYEDFKQAVPIRDYEDLKPYIERVKNGEPDVLWPGRPAYFAKTSGTTPRMNAKEVIKIGRSRIRQASTVASRGVLPDS